MNKQFKFPYCPQPPDWRLCWNELLGEMPWLASLEEVPQDPVFHQEGDVLTHTGMVCEELTKLTEWRKLPETERNIVFAACLLHDVAKADVTRTDQDGRISTRGHSRTGACRARLLLDNLDEVNGLDVSFRARESVVALVRRHGLPYNFVQDTDPDRSVFRASQSVRCDHLALVAEADIRGRIGDATSELLRSVDLFREFAKDHGCFEGPKEFPSAHTRFVYFRSNSRLPDFQIYDDTCCSVTLMAGLPGAGKSEWLAQHCSNDAMISLDAIREQLNVSPAKSQGRVVNHAKELAREYLRQGHPFVWDATNLSQQMRSQLIDLFASYRARIQIVFVDTPMPRLLEQNRSRDDVVPEKVLWKLAQRLDLPDLTEAHEVYYVADGETLVAPAYDFIGEEGSS